MGNINKDIRRNISYKITIKNSEDSKTLLKGIWSPEVKDYRDVIEDYIEISRKRINSKLSMFKLQVNIVDDIVAQENYIKGYREFITNPEKAQEFMEKDEKVDEFHIDNWTNKIQAAKIIKSALKSIGDGILWRMYDYERSLFYAMCTIEDGGPISIDVGTYNEILSFQEIVMDKSIVKFLFHPISNFARIGDISYIKSDSERIFAEVKSKKGPRGAKWKSRIERQTERLENFVHFLKRGKGLLGETEYEILELEGKPKTEIQSICSTIAASEKHKVSSAIFSNYLGLVVVDVNQDNFDEKKLDEEFKKMNSFFGKDTVKLDTSTFILFSPYRAPFSIYPMSSGLIADVLLGKKFCYLMFSKKIFEDEITKIGWEVISFGIDKSIGKSGLRLIVKTSKGIIFSLPAAIIFRVLFEGMHIEELVKIQEQIGIEHDGKSLIIKYEDEKDLWF